ncbi:hypothetical protein [Streptomyces cucumeris]|uniref:hypothetical protein n=1 Tax=Streptomyces cucumeris TaxID=2962890 RepID=UPI003D73BD1D
MHPGPVHVQIAWSRSTGGDVHDGLERGAVLAHPVCGHHIGTACGGVDVLAAAGIGVAVWDIKAKAAGLPLYGLLGGRARHAATAYTHVSGSDPDEIAGLVRAVGLLHDAPERLAPAQARQFISTVEPARLFFLEDVLSSEDSGHFPYLRAAGTVPLAMGELFSDPAQPGRTSGHRGARCQRAQLRHPGSRRGHRRHQGDVPRNHQRTARRAVPRRSTRPGRRLRRSRRTAPPPTAPLEHDRWALLRNRDGSVQRP